LTSPSSKIYLTFELALNENRHADQESSVIIDPRKTFQDALLQLLAEHIYTDQKYSLSDLEVYINRSPHTSFFPIAANESQTQAFQRSLTHPSHTKMTDVDYALTVDAIIQKYKIAVFTVYLKITQLK
jgi:dTDP-4-amino-4,6-dideoxygalactose transaminase